MASLWRKSNCGWMAVILCPMAPAIIAVAYVRHITSDAFRIELMVCPVKVLRSFRQCRAIVNASRVSTASSALASVRLSSN